MEIIYCEHCSKRIPSDEFEQGRAVRVGDSIAYCAACAEHAPGAAPPGPGPRRPATTLPAGMKKRPTGRMPATGRQSSRRMAVAQPSGAFSTRSAIVAGTVLLGGLAGYLVFGARAKSPSAPPAGARRAAAGPKTTKTGDVKPPPKTVDGPPGPSFIEPVTGPRDTPVAQPPKSTSTPAAPPPPAKPDIPMPAAASTGPPAAESHWLEAELPVVIAQPMEIQSDDDASGGGFIQIPKNAKGGCEAVYEVEVAEAGDYVLWGRHISAYKHTNSFRISIGNGRTQTWDMMPLSQTWTWYRATNRGKRPADSTPAVDPVVFKLTAGKQRIYVKRREWGVKLDKLLLTKDLKYRPSGTGPAAGNVPAARSGTVEGAVAEAPAATDISAEGTLDWVHWGLTDAESVNRKTGVRRLIGDMEALGRPAKRHEGGAVKISWTGGEPTASAADAATGILWQRSGSGLRLSVPADTSPRTLRLHFGVWKAVVRLEAALTDNSAPGYLLLLNNYKGEGAVDRVATITYRAASAGQKLVVTYTDALADRRGGGRAALSAATLSGTAVPVAGAE